MAASLKFVLVTRLFNVTLFANLILLANDVSLNPGPASAPSYKVKGLKIYHLNIHSLRNKMDELRLFCDEYKPQVLCLNETWLDENISDEELRLTGSILSEVTEIVKESAWQFISRSICSSSS